MKNRIPKIDEFINESGDYKKYMDPGCNYISEIIEKNPEIFTGGEEDEFVEYVIANNRADRDSGELQDVSKEENSQTCKRFFLMM